MKILMYIFILLLFPTACISSASSIPVNVKSWDVIEANKQNKIIQQAYRNKFKWVSTPEHYIFNLFDLSNVKRISYEYNADSMENPKIIELTLVRDGFLDDSVRGDIQYMKLNKNDKGIWEIVFIKKAISCWRNKKLIYSSEPCL